MKNCNCNNCSCSKHPEGIQITIEILEGLPENFLDQFKEKLKKYPHKSSLDIWKEVIDNWFNK